MKNVAIKILIQNMIFNFRMRRWEWDCGKLIYGKNYDESIFADTIDPNLNFSTKPLNACTMHNAAAQNDMDDEADKNLYLEFTWFIWILWAEMKCHVCSTRNKIHSWRTFPTISNNPNCLLATCFLFLSERWEEIDTRNKRDKQFWQIKSGKNNGPY